MTTANKGMTAMMRRILPASALGARTNDCTGLRGLRPASAEQCHKLHSEIADVVAKATIPAGTKAKLDEQFAKLKGHWDTAAFVEAGQTIAAIRDTAGLKN